MAGGVLLKGGINGSEVVGVYKTDINSATLQAIEGSEALVDELRASGRDNDVAGCGALGEADEVGKDLFTGEVVDEIEGKRVHVGGAGVWKSERSARQRPRQPREAASSCVS